MQLILEKRGVLDHTESLDYQASHA